MLAGSIATGRPDTAPSYAAPTSDSSHTAIQPQTTTDAIVTRTTISTSARSGEAERWWRGKSDGMFTFAATQSRQNSLPHLTHQGDGCDETGHAPLPGTTLTARPSSASSTMALSATPPVITTWLVVMMKRR